MRRAAIRAGTWDRYYEGSFLKRVLGDKYAELKKMVEFRPDDTHDLHQAPPAKMSMPNIERIKGYRYPSPGSQPTAVMPDEQDMKYDIKYFSRNTRRGGHLDEKSRSNRYFETMSTGATELATVDDDMDIGSPGTHYTANTVKAYDPTALRSAMTATHAETHKAIQSKMPTHNVKFLWEERIAEINALTTDKGLPPVPGYNFEGVSVEEAKVAQW